MNDAYWDYADPADGDVEARKRKAVVRRERTRELVNLRAEVGAIDPRSPKIRVKNERIAELEHALKHDLPE